MHNRLRKGSIAFFLACFFAGGLNAQTQLFFENFNSGTGQFTLNTTDVNSSNASSNYNLWIVNNSYTGGNGTAGMCPYPNPLYPVLSDQEFINVPMQYTFNNTPHQPGGITGGPTGNYMHITSPGGPMNAGYLGVDAQCLPSQNYFTRMNTDVTTTGYSEVSIKFWWIGTGAKNSHVELYYSTNEGASWSIVNAFVANYTHGNPNYVYANNSNWTQQTVTIPEFANQAKLRIGFRLANGVHDNQVYSGQIGYGFDDITIIGSESSNPTPTVTTGNVTGTSFCAGSNITVPYSSTGTFNAGNTFTVQLSDASGNFSSPVSIGSITSTSGSGSIQATIPQGTALGSSYKVRVVSSAPAVTGTASPGTFAVAGTETLTITTNPANTTSICGNNPVVLSVPAGYTNVTWTPGGSTNSISVTTPGPYSVTATSPSGCSGSGQIEITEGQAPAPSFTYEQPAGFLVEFENTTQNGTSYEWRFYGNVDLGRGDSLTATNSTANPAFSYLFEGRYRVVLIATNDCGTAELDTIVVVTKFISGINDLGVTKMEVFPNPFNDRFQVEVQLNIPQQLRLEVFTILGELIYSDLYTVSGNSSKLVDLSAHANGIYFVRLSDMNRHITRKIIKN